jgi:hypothetical protein
MFILQNKGTANEKRDRTHRRVIRGVVLALGLGVLLLKADFSDILTRQQKKLQTGPAHPASAFVRSHVTDFMKGTTGRNGIIFVLDPVDFGCPPCFDDFQNLTNEIRSLMQEETARRGTYLLRQAPWGPWSDSTVARRWAQAQDLPFPLVMVPETTHATFRLSKSSVLVVDESLETVRIDQFPLTRKAHAAVQLLMERKRDVDNP